MKLKELEGVLKSYNKITILGHDNIDVDAFLSGILLSRLLDYLNIKNEFLILEEIKEGETYQIIKELFNIDLMDYYSREEEVSRKLFLADHYETSHLGEVVACLDHHPTAKTIEYPFYSCRISCATAYLVYELMQEAKYPLSTEEAKMILSAMMVDTVCFRNTKTIKSEVEESKRLAEKFKLDYDGIEKICLCLTKVDGVSIDTIIENGYKNYDFCGNRVKSSYVQIYKMVDKETISTWLEYIQKKIKENELDMWIFIIYELQHTKTYEYHVLKESVEVIVSQGILSRGKDIIPRIEEKLS